MIDIPKLLVSLGACDKAQAFAGMTPDEALAIASPSDISWLCSAVLTVDEKAAFEEATAPAGRAWEEAVATARRAYEEATAPARRAYEEARATAGRAYDEAVATARRAALRSSVWWERRKAFLG